MKRIEFLAISISMALNGIAVAQQSGEGPIDLGTIVVTAPPLEPPRQIQLGSGGGGDGVYFWENTDRSAGGDITPEDFEVPNPIDPLVCALMVSAGFPEGCTRNFAETGRPPVSSISDPWQFDRLGNFAANGSQLRGHFTGSLAALRTCYEDQANDPMQCETDYQTRIRNVCNTFAYPFPTFQIILADPMPDRDLCLQGADNIDIRMSNAAGNRVLAPWYDEVLDIGGAQLRFLVNLGLALGMITFMDQYNELLTSSRDWRNCTKVIEAWDANECGTEIPG